MKKKRGSFFGLLLLCLLTNDLTGCVSRQETILLPDPERTLDSQEEERTEGFRVQKIYSYEYDTDPYVGRSAFLTDCDPHEIRLWCEGTETEDGFLDLREVDYRYGFYDITGEIPELPEFLFLFGILPSPDGRKALLYTYANVVPETEDNVFIWLYDQEEKTLELLGHFPWDGYSDLLDERMPGSWSELGNFVTFDAYGTMDTGIYVYDTRKKAEVSWKSWEEAFDADPETGLRACDWELQVPDGGIRLAAGLSESAEGEVALVSLLDDGEDTLRAVVQSWSPEEIAENASGTPDPRVWMGGISSNETYLYYGTGRICFQYQLSPDSGLIYTPYSQGGQQELKSQLFVFPLTTEGIYELSGEPVFFQVLEDGSFLVAQTPAPETTEGAIDPPKESYEAKTSSSLDFLSPLDFQWNFGIGELDLYLYTDKKEEGEVHREVGSSALLYKGIRHLLAMEYDPETRRILLETVPDYSDRSHRMCIVLEM